MKFLFVSFMCTIALSLHAFGQTIDPECNLSILSRRMCGSEDVDGTSCRNMGCCYDAQTQPGYIKCFRKDRRANINFEGTVKPKEVGRSRVYQEHWELGGEPGYPGNRGLIQCDRFGFRRPCINGFISKSMCRRIGCCWDFVSSNRIASCYRATYIITSLRSGCSPGFKNAPRCEDIDECASNPCQNNGVCINLINSYRCSCPGQISGVNCENACQPPPSSTSLSFLPLQSTYMANSIVTYNCIATNEIVTAGMGTNLCSSSGLWSMTVAPTCEQVLMWPCSHNEDWCSSQPLCGHSTCPKLPACTSPPASGSFGPVGATKAKYRVGERVPYMCIPSTLTLVGASENECLPNGDWSFTAGSQCSNNVCPPVPTIVNGFFDMTSPQNLALDTIVTYTCNPDFTMVGSNRIVCQLGAGPQWSGVAPLCQKSCSDPNAHGPSVSLTYVGSQTAPFATGTLAVYSCVTSGTIIVGGNANQRCLSDGSWSPLNPPTCSNMCTNLPQILSNGADPSPIGPTYMSGAIVAYNCMSGFLIQGVTSNECLGNLMWLNSAAPICTQECMAPPTSPTATIAVPQSNYVEGDVVMYTCLSGTNPASTNTCSGGTWSSMVAPTCGNYCPELPTIAQFGSNDPTGLYHLESTSITYSCMSGYTLSGVSSNLCLSTLAWRNAAPQCLLDCPTPPIPAMATFTGLAALGQTITYTCMSTYVFNGAVTTNMCIMSGGTPTWMNALADLSQCMRGCGPPPLGLSGMVSSDLLPSIPLHVPDTIATYMCPIGYNIIGATTNRCLSTLTWESTEPSCSQQTCPDISVPANGGVLVPSNLTPGQSTGFTCQSGHTMQPAGAMVSCTAGLPPTLSGIVPQCIAYCPEPAIPTVPARGAVPPLGPTFTPTGTAPYIHATVATYTCPTGYVPVNNVLTCSLPNSVFTPDVSGTQCLQECASPPYISISDLRFNPISTPYKQGDSTTYLCLQGTLSIPGATTTCDNGDWTIQQNDLPTCDSVCGPPPLPPTNSLPAGQTTFTPSSVFTYGCQNDYQYQGPATNMCILDGTTYRWFIDDAAFTGICVRICSTPPPISIDLVFIPEPHLEGSYNYQCFSPTQSLTGPSQVTCKPDGTWEPAILTTSCFDGCLFNQLPANTPGNGYFMNEGPTFPFSSALVYTCNANYEFETMGSPYEVQCTLSTTPTWVVIRSTPCKRICLDPTIDPSVVVVPQAGSYLEGQSPMLTCQLPTPISVGALPVCQSDGTWDYGASRFMCTM